MVTLGSAKPPRAGSIPARASLERGLENFKQTTYDSDVNCPLRAGMVKLVDTLALGASALVACWFESSSGYSKKLWRSQGFFCTAQVGSNPTHGFSCAFASFDLRCGLSLFCGYQQPHRGAPKCVHCWSRKAVFDQRPVQR